VAIRLTRQLIGRPHSYHNFYSQETIFNATVDAAAATPRSQDRDLGRVPLSIKVLDEAIVLEDQAERESAAVAIPQNQE
jgi:hypothetical protein